MRQYRGKRKDTGEWVYGWLVVTDKAHYIIPNHVEEIQTVGGGRIIKRNDMIEVYPETVGQSSGLRDRNGKEIYEGDIVKVGMNGAITEVIFEDGSFLTIVGESRYRLGGWETDAVEVLGNRFDHPHLLKGVSE